MGTRLWYNFCSPEIDEDAAFEKSLDSLCREIGERSKPLGAKMAEGVPPRSSPAPQAPVPTSSLASAPGLAVAPAPTTPSPAVLAAPSAMESQSWSYTPTLQQLTAPSALDAVDQTALITALKGTVEQLSTAREVISDSQLEALQRRLEVLHMCSLLTDEQFGCLEDCVADGIEATATCDVLDRESVHSDQAMSKLHKMIVLSQKMPQDAMFARQARRKFSSL
jgi:hypothetical protein